jgi:hypothetical protein
MAGTGSSLNVAPPSLDTSIKPLSWDGPPAPTAMHSKVSGHETALNARPADDVGELPIDSGVPESAIEVGLAPAPLVAYTEQE